MRLSETITIYLAVGAPFGVNYFQREYSGQNQSRARSLLKATGVGLLWPLMAIAAFLSRRSDAAPLSSAAESESAIDERTSQKIAAAQQQLLTALDRVRELAQQKTVNGSEELERSTRALREGVEKYVGLTLALAEMSLDDSPASSEMELCRIAGREGDDLLLAGRCIHRRNVARLIAHQSRSRVELLHALAAVREIGGAKSARLLPDATLARQMSLAVLKFYVQAINLLTLLEDESAATSAARLLDAECARLRSLEAASVDADALPFTAPSRVVV
ncbi:MAG TPA: hypothetical protein VF658_02670 [Pyrinomonadaceae bacterium]|jgi:hypothetical protein